jgi:hypothetical protein
MSSPDLAERLTRLGLLTYAARTFDATGARDFKRSVLTFEAKMAAAADTLRRKALAHQLETWTNEVAKLRRYQPKVLTPEVRREIAERDARLAMLTEWIAETNAELG